MWNYEKRLEYPIKIKNPNPALAKFIISQYGGPDGELGASLRYLSQRYSMPYRNVAGVLTDIGTEELAHLEMVATIVHQLTRDIRRRRQASRLMRFALLLRAMPSQTCPKTWLRNKKPAPPMITSSACATTRTSSTRSVS